MIFLDFETRSECDIKKCGAWVYSEHPSTEILCLAWAKDDGPVQLWTPDKKGFPLPFPLDDLLEAHSAFFERSIWENICVKRMGWPKVAPEQWRCSAARVAARALPRSLAGAGAALKVSFQKSLEGKKRMLKVSKPRKPTNNDPSRWEEDPMDMYKLYEYCKTDVEAERAISKVVRYLTPKELAVWQLDQAINARGILIDKDGCNAAIHVMAQIGEKLTTEFSQLVGEKIKSPTQRNRLLEWLSDEGTAMNGMTKNDVLTALGGSELSPAVRRVLEIRQQLSRTSTAKYVSMLNAAAKDGRVRDTLMYHGAATGRWTGRLVQLQNIPRGVYSVTEESIRLLKTANVDLIEEFYPDVAGFVASCIRGMLIAAPGKTLIAADYAAIEARVLFWLAGEQHGLDLYAKKEDLYVEIAKKIYNTETVTKTQRAVGKTTILGCGYSMGALKFKTALANNAGVTISDEFSKSIVDTYRRTFPAVPRFWYATETAAIMALRNPGKKVPCQKVSWGYNAKENVLYCQLPSGRMLAYNEPQVKASERFEGKMELSCMVSSQGQYVRESTYGGKLVENITQAAARDLLAEAMMHVQEAGYHIVMTVHDEIVCEISSMQDVEKQLQDFIGLMVTLPAWATGCPIEAEGWYGKRYKK